MRANRKMREFDDEKAEVGIGTMIVFIATVLVAAIAAGVLLDTSGKLQERSSRTGQAATSQVASNLNVDSLVGYRNATNGNLEYLDFFLSLAAGADKVDMSMVRLLIADDTNWRNLTYTGESSATAIGWGELREFTAFDIRDADSSFDQTTPVMTEGDYVKVRVNLDTANGQNLELAVREHVTVTFSPEVGGEVVFGFDTPPSYGADLVISLR